jgi:hypothetical protein
MPDTQTGYAHIITSEAEALGDPGIIVLNDDPEGDPSIVLGDYRIDGTAPLEALLTLLRLVHEWTPTGDPVEIATGYHIVSVQRSTD